MNACNALLIQETEWKPFAANAGAVTKAQAVIEAISERSLARDEGELSRAAVSELCAEALLLGYCGTGRPDDRYGDAVVRRVNAALILGPNLTHFGILGGLSEIAWTLQHLSNLAIPDGTDEGGADQVESFSSELDSSLISALHAGGTAGFRYDLSTGIVGVGLYFLERLPSPRAADGLELIVSILDRCSEKSAQGITWRSTPKALTAAAHSDAIYCLGLSEGVAGVIQFLGEAWAAGIARELCAALADGAVAWLLSQPAPVRGVMRFGPWVINGRTPRASRLGWCHGDLSIACALFQASRRFNRPEWEAHARILLTRCLTLPTDAVGVNDCWLCHGSAGIAHIYRRLFEISKDVRCREAAAAWLDWTLSERNPSNAMNAIDAAPKSQIGSLRNGTPGLGLALLAAATNIVPDWDRLLLLSGRKLAPCASAA